ncbi:polysaccharide pyruvyl transferase family protein [Photobacterium kishitanii]|uniref:polysaccharide pyruvyl transferase family protein n=1 Tax=Photobacterium kishitanii TaxID=318456 RepID=UPI00043107A6|nr:polysaccharide pyruvyl transferase family protein [Photobacterium kishitanii]CEO38468.1 putative Polysaccharide pyruvyl transferase [Photobacterium kishitanii]
MRVATLTLPFHANYGAVLQAYALQVTLKSFGHDVYSLDIDRRSLRPLFKYSLSRIKGIVTKGEVLDNYNYGNKKFKKFIENEIALTKKIKFQKDFMRNDIQNFDAYIVGSDQVWRPKYVMNIGRYFLDFVKNDKIKISYAASFGTDDFEYSNDEYKKCSILLSDFKGVSVREFDGIDKCKDKLLSSSELVLDPTLLVNVNVYNNLIDKYSEKKLASDFFCYILDPNKSKMDYINKAFNHPYVINHGLKSKDKDSIGCWLKGIRDCNLVITDSFHGVVFSIIFNKEFIAIGNSDRGLARFKSILKVFNLTDRLINEDQLSIDNLKIIANSKIDYINVNKILNEKRNESFDFIAKHLS